MHGVTMGFTGLLGLAALVGVTAPAGAATWTDGLGTKDVAVQYSLVSDRYDRHRGYYHHRGHGWGGWNRHYRQHYYPRYYSNRYYYRSAPNVYYYQVPPQTYYVVPPPVQYYEVPSYGYYDYAPQYGSGFNFGFNLDIHR